MPGGGDPDRVAEKDRDFVRFNIDSEADLTKTLLPLYLCAVTRNDGTLPHVSDRCISAAAVREEGREGSRFLGDIEHFCRLFV